MNSLQVYIRHVVTSLVLLLFLNIHAVDAASAASRSKMLKIVVSLTVNDVDISDVFKTLSTHYKIPLGLEQKSSADKNSSISSKITANLKKKTLEDALNIITKNSDYKWEFIDGVINVVPRVKESNILDIDISSFNCKSASKKDIENKIYSLKVLKSVLANEGLSEGFVFTVKPQPDKTKITINHTDTSIRKILNEVARQNHYWTTLYLNKQWFVSIY